MRATVSVEPPGGNGTRKRIGRLGQLASGACAEAAPAASAQTNSMTVMRIIKSLLHSASVWARYQVSETKHQPRAPRKSTQEFRAMIDLHYWTTPNGHKITIFLEEAAVPYRIIPVNIGKG